MNQAALDRFRRIVYDRSGIVLGASKEALIRARLAKRMRALGIQDPKAYLRRLAGDGAGAELVALVDVVSTNVTSFFREEEHFSFLQQAVSKWAAGGQRRFRFWSAACSTGEEPLSMAMAVLEALGGRAGDLKILATDISTRVLEHCSRGVYEKAKLAAVPVPLRERYFESRAAAPETPCAVREELKRRVVFRWLNLSKTPFPMRGPFDAIFCRNVMIYFDKRVRRQLLAEIERLLKPGGYLMVGHAESLAAMGGPFRIVMPSVYRRA
ncbi:MAG: CheR family methyltransferase [bacterium]